MTEPRQSSPVNGTEYYDPEFETKWTEYDPDRANTLLDEIGLTERDADGYRMFPNGKELKFIFTVLGFAPLWARMKIKRYPFSCICLIIILQ
jgi:ABC-type transport system substrate-binding protein